MSEPVTCGWCGLTHDSPRSEVVHRGTRECVDSAACAARMAQKENDALLQERDAARAEVARLKEVLSLAATCILKQCRCMEECGCVPASVLAALPKEEP